MLFVEPANGTEKQAVARHRIINARAGQDQPIDTSESGNRDRDRHDDSARAAQDGAEHGRGYTIISRGSNLGQGQRAQVRDIGEEI